MTASSEDLTRRIAERVRHMRQMRGFSLEELAQRTQVSKAMLSQIERAASNPSVNLLWKVAAGLAVPFSHLLEDASPEVEVAPSGSRTQIGDAQGYGVEMLLAARSNNPIDVYELAVQPSSVHAAEGHPAGTTEILVQLTGTLTLGLPANDVTLRAGDAVRFRADVSHSYRNDGTHEGRALCIIAYGGLD